MATNHTHSSLDLSALNSDVEYPLPLDNTAKRCLIHVKLTESCSKAIDNLITSNRGAVFSLWFTENGGHLTLPSSNGAHTFQFSTAVPNKREQNSTLECFHQLTNHDRQQHLSMIGRLEHKLTVKATDDVYEETKKKAKLLEEERQGVRAKEIKIPKVVKPKSKLGNNRATHKPPFDTSLGRPPFNSSSTGPGRGGGGAMGGANSKLPHVGGTGRAQQKSLKERVVHILAIKPCRRIDVVSKLKKATKKSESFFSNLDSVLSEVAYLQESTYHLKDNFYSQLDVESWPFYNEAERDLVKRKLARMSSISSNDTSISAPMISSMPSVKRLADESVVNNHTPSKRPKTHNEPINNNNCSLPTPVLPFHNSRQVKPLNEPSTTNEPSITTNERKPPQRSSDIKSESSSTTTDRINKFLSNRYITESHKVPTIDAPNQEISKKKEASSSTQAELHVHVSNKHEVVASIKNEVDVDVNERVEPEGEQGEEKNHKHKKKKKKKHKHEEKVSESSDVSFVNQMMVDTRAHDNPSAVVTHRVNQTVQSVQSNDNNNDSNISLPNFESLYPKITSSKQRANYKSLFNNEYKDYLILKDKMDSIQAEVSLLSDQLFSLPHNSPEVREVKHKIRKKYREMQQDTSYQEEKKRLFYLHYKLDHIKKMVVLYDKQQQS